MNKVLTKKISYSICFCCLSGLAVFSSLMSSKSMSFLQKLLLLLMIVFAIASNYDYSKILINKKIPRFYVSWLLFLVFVLYGVTMNFFGSSRIICCVLLALLLCRDTSWIEIMKKCVMFFTGINVLGTYFFLLFPQYYPKMIELYGYIPSGTSKGEAGYRAGIANHYSQNGIYISVFFLILITLMLARFKKDKKFLANNKILIASVFVTLAALLLTGKRGVLIWSIIAVTVTYMVSDKFKVSTIVRFILIVAVVTLSMYLLSFKIPAITYVFSRFQKAGEDNASLERFEMWKMAIEKFKDNPIFGNGFWKFRQYYSESDLSKIYHHNDERYQNLNAHNVYLQLLCETGVVGLALYLTALGSVLTRTVILVRNMKPDVPESYRFGAMLSMNIQIFYIIYSMTGNCLYDMVFYFYAVALALTMCLSYRSSKSQFKKPNKKYNLGGKHLI